MYQVIARKYRPSAFAELIGQDHVRTTLENAIRQKRIAHGYIFSGQRGTGKTTVARILARCLNCAEGPTAVPCGQCTSCVEIAAGSSVDVIEIDAASNRGINEMRELRENVRYRPARDLYKVFIVDEAHQITSEAFNALLKTLEEPPEWVVFILCTTEAHKIPTTIASRCQHFSFRSVEFAEVVARMRWICEQEGIEAGDESLAVLAQAGEGSVRDSLSALDQAIACCGTTLDAASLRSLLGRFSLESLSRVTESLAASDSAGMFEIVQGLERSGHNLQHFCRELARYFRNLLVARIAGKETPLIGASPAEQQRLRETAAGFSEEDLTRYLQLTLDLFKDLQFSTQPRLHLEIGLLKLVHAGRLLPIEEALASIASGGPPAPRPAAPVASNPPLRRGPSPLEADLARKTNPAPEAPPPPPAPPAGNLRVQLADALRALGMTFTADAVEHSLVTEAAGEVAFTTPKEFSMAMNEADLRKALQSLGRPARMRFDFSEEPVNVPVERPAGAVSEDELTRRALSHPDVKRFQELFPGAQVRAVRNLKE
ncbi:MAG: DNA polymerase III subunit gamma/tau [Acidobacteria bacterium]|nr:DNA polymerase III subunit gamma/tau [Acidobacteriota bacterium]